MSKHTKDCIMAQAQVFASSWSLVGGRFDNGNEIDNANQQKADLAEMVADVVKQRDELLAACRFAVVALAHAAERHTQYRPDYKALSDAIDEATEQKP